VPADARRIALTTIRRAGAIGLALGLGLGLTSAFPALANTGGRWHHGSDDHGTAWGLNVAGDDGPAWGLTVTDHGPAWGAPVHGHDINLPVVLDGDVAASASPGSTARRAGRTTATGGSAVSSVTRAGAWVPSSRSAVSCRPAGVAGRLRAAGNGAFRA